MSTPQPEPPFAATRKALAEALAQIDGLLPGSVVVRLMRCGKSNCACKADPPDLARALHPVDPHCARQDRHRDPDRRAARPLPALVRQQPATQGPHRQARDRLATSHPDRRRAGHPEVDASPQDSKTPDIAPALQGIPPQGKTNTRLRTPISASQPHLHGSRTQINWLAHHPRGQFLVSYRALVAAAAGPAKDLEAAVGRARRDGLSWQHMAEALYQEGFRDNPQSILGPPDLSTCPRPGLTRLPDAAYRRPTVGDALLSLPRFRTSAKARRCTRRGSPAVRRGLRW